MDPSGEHRNRKWNDPVPFSGKPARTSASVGDPPADLTRNAFGWSSESPASFWTT